MSLNRRVPLTALFKPARVRDAVPRIDRLTVTAAMSDGNTITLDVAEPLGASLDYRDEYRSCTHHMALAGPKFAVPCRCQEEQELVLSIQLDPWRDGEPAYTATTQPTPERGSSP
ncbi:hypothetical protein AB0F17_43225 [Nonomuraea sp. NPDC026600]|uniref:hypothetical protein n=1 Tax=Nonomuraea sp. NPDC026600 TaxID=3155363 RepID=UPI0033F7D312